MRYLSTRRQIEGALPTVVDLLRARGEKAALHVLTLAEIDLQHTDDDNWNGGTELWTAFIRLPVSSYVEVEDDLKRILDVINTNLQLVCGKDEGFWVAATITPAKVRPHGSGASDGRLGLRTRRALLDEMRARGTVWFGGLDEGSFLSRIYDLSSLPSSDSRFDNAAGDIWQHCVNNSDWPLDWICGDARFKLYDADQEVLLRFVCEVVHPVVRKDPSEQAALVNAFNGHLAADGWELVEDQVIDGRPIYVPQRKVHALGRPLHRMKAVAATLDSATLYEDLRRLERIRDAEPGEAIALAKEIVEGCCKLILDDRKVPYSATAEIPDLLKLLRRELKIMPEGIDETAKGAPEIRDILTSLGKIAHSLAPLRNAYGKGHGRGRSFKGLQPRHARLAIGAASTFVDFVLDRHSST
ncbi:MAG: abortive infection family protein [Paracoccus sp.]|nr:abortive infection family protein [Paracoccus sp. (in: a-proteobacteria)]